jgi:hypothetical protein
MSNLKALNWVTATKAERLSNVERRRIKLCTHLDEQIGLATAQKTGEAFTVRRSKSVRNKETGERVTVEGTKRLRAWYWTTKTGAFQLSIRYGSKILAVGKTNAIEVKTLDELIAALTTLKQATLAGELDAQIAECAGILSSGFKGAK